MNIETDSDSDDQSSESEEDEEDQVDEEELSRCKKKSICSSYLIGRCVKHSCYLNFRFHH